MKKNNFILALLFVLAGSINFSFTTATGPGTLAVSTQDSKIQWKGYKVTGEHAGNVALKSGELQFNDAGELTGGTFTMDMSSITVTDLQGEWAQKLEGHLKSSDFFGVEKHPVAKFVITKISPKGTPGDYKVTGNLTIKETTKEIKFYANVQDTGNAYKATADITIDRTEFDVRYGSGNFFDNLGDKTIYDEFDLSVSLLTSK